MKPKAKKHIAAATDFDFVPDTFKLFGEVAAQGDATGLRGGVTRADTTGELFPQNKMIVRLDSALRSDNLMAQSKTIANLRRVTERKERQRQ